MPNYYVIEAEIPDLEPHALARAQTFWVSAGSDAEALAYLKRTEGVEKARVIEVLSEGELKSLPFRHAPLDPPI